jgi:hypothetical protein
MQWMTDTPDFRYITIHDYVNIPCYIVSKQERLLFRIIVHMCAYTLICIYMNYYRKWVEIQH